MRTTVTLDPDVAAALEQAARERRVSFKQVLNDAVRAGLRPATEARPYRLPTRRMGLRAGVDLDKALKLAAELEDQEVVRKLELRK
ncbi:MAG TPA: CopG family transcriptional regulator [Acidimicrobiales bacterium]|nr:CopG family transcriptional regulator [Acidimicrobiales bacterium]